MLEHITFIHSGVVTEKRIIEMMSRIDGYVRGRLTQEQIDELWVEFLKELY